MGERRGQEERKNEGKENSPESRVKSVLGRTKLSSGYTQEDVEDKKLGEQWTQLEEKTKIIWTNLRRFKHTRK